MARPGRKKRTALFIVEIICLLLFIADCMYMDRLIPD